MRRFVILTLQDRPPAVRTFDDPALGFRNARCLTCGNKGAATHD